MSPNRIVALVTPVCALAAGWAATWLADNVPVFSGSSPIDTPLDASAIHPESYKVALAVLKRANLAQPTPPAERAPALDTLWALNFDSVSITAASSAGSRW